MGVKQQIVKLINFRKGPQMIWGYKNPKGVYCPKTRISNTTFIDHPENLNLGDNVFIGHYNFIEASHGITIEEGCQITNFSSITSHSSHISIRLYGRHYTDFDEHEGFITGEIRIGKYTFIGPHCVIMPKSDIGKGSIISAFSFVKGTYPDYSIIQGNPARVMGDTREMDEQFLKHHPHLKKFYDEWTIKSF
ncbi:MAG: acyltransferase [Bacteroidales bacterium]|nr:acyltransferase [Bacteroidales bacterium]